MNTVLFHPQQRANQRRQRTTLEWLAIAVSLITMFSVDPRVFKQEAQASSFNQTRVHLSDSEQRIEGFGLSAAWWAQEVGQFAPKDRDLLLDLLFHPVKGIGVDHLRYNIGAGPGHDILDPWRSTETFEISPGVYDWSRDQAAQRVLLEAVERGVSQITLFANSPPARMTYNERVDQGSYLGGSNLKPEYYEAFSRYLLDITDHFRHTLKLPVTSLSPINEPQHAWLGSEPIHRQEGCHYEPEEAAALIRTLAEELEQKPEHWRGLRIAALDSSEWKKTPSYLTALSDSFADRPELADRLDIAIHSYWSKQRDRVNFWRWFDAFAQTSPVFDHQNTVHMTEWTEMRGERDSKIGSALTLAETIHTDFTLGRAKSWSYWIGVSKYNWTDGLIYIDPLQTDPPKEGQGESWAMDITKRLWAYGQFTRFVHPGFERLPTAEDSARQQVDQGQDFGRLRTLAFASPNRDRLSIIWVNSSFRSRDIHVDLVGKDSSIDLQDQISEKYEAPHYTCKLYVTDKEHNLEMIDHEALHQPQPQKNQRQLTGGQLWSVPSRSISTLACERR